MLHEVIVEINMYPKLLRPSSIFLTYRPTFGDTPKAIRPIEQRYKMSQVKLYVP